LSVNQGVATLWVNAERVGQAPLSSQELNPGLRLSFAAFTSADPLLKLEHLIQEIRIYGQPLDDTRVRARFDEAGAAIQRRIIYPGLSHFNAGPILSHVTQDSATVVFETDRPSTAMVGFGTRTPLDREVASNAPRTIHQVRLSGLSPSTLYYYHVRARSAGGGEIDAGSFTFRTAAPPGEPVHFAVIGDTEARPHVNDRIAKLIWDQRPDFVLNLGDLTDGGVKARKAEWNLEFFLALTQLHSRIPVFSVPGNGEYGDRELFWYQQYMAAPLDQGSAPGFYSFRHGDAEFFMLDSNPRAVDFKPGGLQYRWIEVRLAKSTARWKVVCHHHPIYTSADHGSTAGKPADPVDRDALPIAALYERYSVDIALAGHIHHYERSHPLREGKLAPNGVVYITSGGAGGNLQGFGPARSWFTAMMHLGYHFCTIAISGRRLEFRMYGIDGACVTGSN
jgi:3',5'-cyclic AMP phosphodiesterase CpdA